jgi:hypothetical protein
MAVPLLALVILGAIALVVLWLLTRGGVGAGQGGGIVGSDNAIKPVDAGGVS